MPSADDLQNELYEKLLKIASNLLRGNRSGYLHTGTLANEAWLKLRKSPRLAALPPREYAAVAVKAMRQVIVDFARRQRASKRGGPEGAAFVDLDLLPHQLSFRGVELIMLDDALIQLEKMSPRQAKVVEYRFLLGMDLNETAAMLDVSVSAVERDWRAARAWLLGRMTGKQ